LINLNIHPTRYPAGWQLVLASLKAGTVEEIVYRFFVVSLFSWLGGLIRKNSDGRPVELVYLSAILLAGLIFGWAHVDAKLSAPGVSVFPLAIIMTLSTILGIYFGWILWKFGLEWAIIAHFLYDALFSAVVMPAYLSNNKILWVAITIGFLIICVLSWRYLTREA
jgi:hypothetical protein